MSTSTVNQSTSNASRWIPSRYAIRCQGEEGDLILYNSSTGAIGVVPSEYRATVLSVLRRKSTIDSTVGILGDLIEGGFVVPEGTNELRLAAQLRQDTKQATGTLHLILMPSETCNFRCVYCYESFQRGKMLPSVRKGIKHFVRQRAQDIKDLTVQWFGGEPTTAVDVIDELSNTFIDLAEEYCFNFSAGITTNAFNLKPQVVDSLLCDHILRYQVTIDGPPEYHDTRRKLLGGGETFERIMENLSAMRGRPASTNFTVALRVNFDRLNHPQIPDLIRLFASEFGGDSRFLVYFRPIGQWGGPNDASLPVCYGTEGEIAMWELHGEAIEQGLPVAALHHNLMPGGSVCYAAQPFSFVIGADGRVYKCTVALDDERNVVGRILSDGKLDGLTSF